MSVMSGPLTNVDKYRAYSTEMRDKNQHMASTGKSRLPPETTDSGIEPKNEGVYRIPI